MYAFLFPLSGFLALAGMILAVRPKACGCSVGIRSGIAGLSLLWMGTGMLCVGMLTKTILLSPSWGVIFAAFHLTSQHVFLSLSLLVFALAPTWMLSKLGIEWSAAATTEAVPTAVSPAD